MTKTVPHKAAEPSGEFTGNKIAQKVVKLKSVLDGNSKNVEEIIIPPEHKKEILNDLYYYNELKVL